MEKWIFWFFDTEWDLIRNKPLISFMKFVIYFEKQSINFFVWVKQIGVIGKHERI